ncbi:MAG: hypothetical protein EU532_01460 [Promethearchaeota archaeon]|nr:MAG: hypothetical protein EU532_01460 [Candidatus Lokiarchaeota archaeon]
MVIVIQRLIQRVYNGKWDELESIDKKFTELENKMGFPPKKRYRCLSSPYDTNTIIIERQWESLAKLEKINTKSFLDPEYQKLSNSIDTIIESQHMELLVPHPAFPE